MGNGFNEWGIGVIEVTKEYLRTSVDGFCVANAMKISNINLVKIWVRSPWLIIMKKLSNCIRNICWRQSKTTLLSVLIRNLIVRWWIDDVRFAVYHFGWKIRGYIDVTMF